MNIIILLFYIYEYLIKIAYIKLTIYNIMLFLINKIINKINKLN
jgi:hypothetical protein